MEYAVQGQLMRGPVLAIVLAACTSCAVSEFDDRLGPTSFCTSPSHGHSPEADAEVLHEHDATVVTNDFETYQASFGNGPEFVYVPTGAFHMGTDNWGPDEQPVHEVNLHGYWIGENLITNERFGTFVGDTGFVTDAERSSENAPAVFRENFVKYTKLNARNGMGVTC